MSNDLCSIRFDLAPPSVKHVFPIKFFRTDISISSKKQEAQTDVLHDDFELLGNYEGDYWSSSYNHCVQYMKDLLNTV